MQIKNYLEEHKMSIADLSNISGVSYACLHGLMNKNKSCNIETCFRIVLATGGHVTANDLIPEKKIQSMVKTITQKREKFLNKRMTT